ncbi:DUF3027 domain-containing protein [Diaminobutyricibacter tongyongensis]|uniref:DUF3027 domain-containing protein n=1 Tax=Leifsonia tongyongensis TaxID=1268043 RepID=A0A6L9XS47_9MICO|nr:DUF3027 domain-containing protein [Diaminobutyricibacter tongyongensis]NEN04250.1 DUF3027 domain-containing protein [Diaminobutyricibacter tongyongensis]
MPDDSDVTSPDADAPEAEATEAVATEAQATETDMPGAAAADVEAPEAEPTADPELLGAVDLARAALFAVTPEATVGPLVGHIVEGEHVLSLLFDSALPGYPGWRWSVTISRLDGEAEPGVLETELVPGEASLLAPDWVPWSERLADYQASQEALAAERAGDDEDADDEDADEESEDDLDDLDEDEDEDDDDDDDAVVPVLHSGDIDGVDIDFDDPELDDDADVDVALDLEAEESAALDADVDETDDAESEAEEDGPEPPAVPGGREPSGEDQD